MKPPDKKQPLAGMRILVGRARHQASALSAGLKRLGADVIEIPFIEIRPPRSYKPLDAALRNIGEYDWLILTSVNGVEALSARMKRSRITPAKFSHLKIAAIGPATRKAIRELGLEVEVVPEQYVAESVVEGLRKKVKGKRVLLARAKVARDVIPRELRKAEAKVDVIDAYQTVVPSASRTKLRSLMSNPKLKPDIVCFTSSSTVRNFFGLLRRQECPRHTLTASIGPITSSTLRDYGLPVHIEAKEYTIPGLVKAIVGYSGRRSVAQGRLSTVLPIRSANRIARSE